MHSQTQAASTALVISDISVRQDAEGRYCLNDLHKSAGGEKRHRPNYWLVKGSVKGSGFAYLLLIIQSPRFRS